MNFMERPTRVGLRGEDSNLRRTKEFSLCSVLASQSVISHSTTADQRSFHEVHNVFPADCLHHFKIFT